METICTRHAAYEAAGVQELVITLPDATHLDTLRQFARAFIVEPERGEMRQH
jgi:hypothetical protein